jgi:hypothetical protein
MGSIRKEASTVLAQAGQLGVAIPGGCDAIAHAARTMSRHWSSTRQTGMCFIKFDAVNAFNEICRQNFVDGVAERFPRLLGYVSAAYGQHTQLLFGDIALSSQCGVQQGDPLGPFLFSLAIMPLCSAARARATTTVPLPLHAWFLDDGCVACDVKMARTYLDAIVELGPAMGLRLNLTKCEVLGNPAELNSLSEAFPELPAARSWDDWHLLGTPCGDDASTLKFLHEVAEQACRKIRIISALPDRHKAFALLRYCVGCRRRSAPALRIPSLPSRFSVDGSVTRKKSRHFPSR